MATPFEQGKIDGTWTEEQVRECGFTSAQACLRHQEKVNKSEVKNLENLRPEYAARHSEYLKGLISATRTSLSDLMKKGF